MCTANVAMGTFNSIRQESNAEFAKIRGEDLNWSKKIDKKTEIHHELSKAKINRKVKVTLAATPWN